MERGVAAQRGSDIDGEAVNDGFGFVVSLSGYGNRVAIGSPDHSSQTGHVRAFELVGSNGQGRWIHDR